MISTAQWVPDGVKRISAEFDTGRAGHRLLNEPVMEPVWNRLTGQPRRKGLQVYTVDPAGIEALEKWQRCSDQSGLNAYEVAAAAVYITCIREISDTQRVPDVELERIVEQFLSIADRCRMQKSLVYIEPIMVNIAASHPVRNKAVASALSAAADYFELLAGAHRKAATLSSGAYKSKEVGKKKSDIVRAQVSAVIMVADRLYAPSMRADLATMMSVGLNQEVTPKDIDNWRTGIERRNRPKS